VATVSLWNAGIVLAHRQRAGGREGAAPVSKRPDRATESGLFFANADYIGNEIRRLAADEKPRAVILDAETVPGIDITAVTMLEELGADLSRAGTEFAIARDIGRGRRRHHTRRNTGLANRRLPNRRSSD
jgi:hypothetical protein